MGERVHTPGPWRLDGAVIRGTRADGKERPVVEVYRRIGGIDQEAIANANLCLAAPEMLEALEGLLDHYLTLANSGDAGFWDPEKEPQVIAARAALAKAAPTSEGSHV